MKTPGKFVKYINMYSWALKMGDITISREKFEKVLSDVENLIDGVTDLLDQDEIAKKRMNDIKASPSIGRTEKELDDYLKKRGGQD